MQTTVHKLILNPSLLNFFVCLNHLIYKNCEAYEGFEMSAGIEQSKIEVEYNIATSFCVQVEYRAFYTYVDVQTFLFVRKSNGKYGVIKYDTTMLIQ